MPEKKQPPNLATRATELPASGIRRFFDIAAQMPDIVSLGVGEPDFVTPWTIREAAIYSLEKGQTSYTSNYGLLELRREINKYLLKRYGVDYRPDDEILVTMGVSEGLDLACRALLNPGDKVLVAEPCYVSYKPCIILAGAVPVTIPTTSETQFRLTRELLEKHWEPGCKALLMGYPSNPTGATMPRSSLQEVVDFAIEKNIYIISDEIYDRLTYDEEHTCAAALPGAFERTIVLNGFSKAFAMTGWRLGYACAPTDIIQVMMKIHSYTALCASITSQKAALEALKSGESQVVEMVAQYRRRRRLIVDGLNNIGLKCLMPKGAFYAFPSIADTGMTADEFAERLLFDEHVAVVPGTAFGAGGDGHIRCSYATSIANIETALIRIERFVSKVAPQLLARSPVKTV